MGNEIDKAVFEAARTAFMNMSGLRSRRRRIKEFVFGNQWDDPVALPDGRIVSERECAVAGGSNPATNNVMRQIVKCIIGHFRRRVAPAMGDGEQSGIDVGARGFVCSLPEGVAADNLIDELDARALEEFLISGCAIQRVADEPRPGGKGPWVDNISPERFFVNRHSDPRGCDIELLGMVHDMPFTEVMARFGSSPAQKEAIKEIYASEAGRCHLGLPSGGLLDAATCDWEGSGGTDGRCRVYEVWTLENAPEMRCHDTEHNTFFTMRYRRGDTSAASLKAENARRRAGGKRPIRWRPLPALRWRCRWFGPEGRLLASHGSPWGHGQHPFVVKLYPLLDGEVHPFLEDIVDQQKHINRLVTLIDHIVGASAKGVLLFPRQAVPAGSDPAAMADAWARPGSVIFYDALAQAKPEIMSSPRNDMAAASLLTMEMGLIDRVSGVGDALRGMPTNASVGAEMYARQVDNAATALRDVFDTFDSFRRKRDTKVLTLKRA